MEMVGCQSSNVKAFGYDPVTQTLAVEFHKSGLYHYHDVPPEVFEGMSKAESAGRFVTQSLRGQFETEKIVPEENA